MGHYQGFKTTGKKWIVQKGLQNNSFFIQCN